MHTLNLYRPKEISGPLPTVVDIHGGGWMYGDRAAQPGLLHVSGLPGLCGDGHELPPGARGDGGRTGPGRIFQPPDLAGPAREEYGFDLSRVLLTGDSAGGHLTGLTACVQLSPALQTLYQVEPLPFSFTALAIAHGVCDVYRFRLFTPLLDRALTREYLHLLLGRPWRRSPLRGHVSFEDTAPGLPLPPILVIASQPDRYYAQSRRLMAYLDASPLPHRVIHWSQQQSARATHVFEVGWWDWPESRDTNDRTLVFFDQVCRGEYP